MATKKLSPMMALSVIDKDLFNWHWSADSRGYLRRSLWECGSKQTIRLHRIVVERMLGRPLRSSEIIDHLNHQPWDNRRSNLRVVTQSQNCMYLSKLRSDNTSGYRGVYFKAVRGKWAAHIGCNGRQRHLGYFDTKEEAHLSYVAAAKRLFGEEYIGATK